MNKKFIYILFALSSAALLANAQNKKERNLSEEIDVIRPYKPVLAESVKLKSNPEISDADTSSLDINYEVIDKRLELKDSIHTLPAEKMESESVSKLYRSYIRLAAGNYNTVVGDIYINSIRNRNGLFGFYAGHHSSHADAPLRDFSRNTLSVYGKRAFDNSTLTGNLGYLRTVNYFNYLEEPGMRPMYDAYFIGGAMHKFDLLSAETELSSNLPMQDNKLNYSFRLKGYSMNDNFKATEYNALPEADLKVKMNKSVIGGYIAFNANQFTDSSVTSYNNVLFLAPSFTYSDTLYSVTVGFNTASEMGSKESFHFYPDISAEYLLSGRTLVAFAGINGNMKLNTFKSFSQENPYLMPGLDIRNTNERSNIFGGLKGNIGKKSAYKAALSYKKQDNMGFFVNDSTPDNRMYVIYDGAGAQVTTFSLEAIHQQTEKLRLSLLGEYLQYDPATEIKAWHLPSIKLKFNSTYNIGNKFLLALDVFHFGKSFAPDVKASGGIRTLKEITDANIGIDYRYSKTFSIFLKFNNITADKYERWMNYPGYGFNVLGGLTLAL